MEAYKKWNRRSFLGGLGLMAGSVFSRPKLWGRLQTSPATGQGLSRNVYEELGVTTIINGQGTMTMLGGSLIPPEVEAAMAAASRHFVSIP